MSTATKSNWRREPFVWLLIAIPASAVLMAAVMVPLAVKTHDGLVVDDYYKRGLEINQTHARDEAATALGIIADVRVDQHQTLVNLRGNASFEMPETVRLQAFHATRSGLDRDIVLSRIDRHHYRGQGLALQPGRWHLQIAAEDWRVMDVLFVKTSTQ